MPEPRSDAELRALVHKRVRAIQSRRARVYRTLTAVALVVALPTIGMAQYRYDISSAATHLLTHPNSLFIAPEPTTSPSAGSDGEVSGETSSRQHASADRRSRQPSGSAAGPATPTAPTTGSPSGPGAPPPAPAVPSTAAPDPSLPGSPATIQPNIGSPPTTTEPATVEPPTIEPPITAPPPTDPPVLPPPVTEPPVTEPPVTEPPVTEPPVTPPPQPTTAWPASQVDMAVASLYPSLLPTYSTLTGHSCGYGDVVPVGTYTCTALGIGNLMLGSFSVTVAPSTNGPDAQPVVSLS